MFTEPTITESPRLTRILSDMMREPEFAVLRDNMVSVGIFENPDFMLYKRGGTISPATELEKKHGYDVIIYMSRGWVNFHRDIEVEAMMYQLLICVTPKWKGRDQIPSIDISNDRSLDVSPETVEKYGENIGWYSDLYKPHKRGTGERKPKRQNRY